MSRSSPSKLFCFARVHGQFKAQEFRFCQDLNADLTFREWLTKETWQHYRARALDAARLRWQWMKQNTDCTTRKNG